ncbi:MAG: mercuric transporter MerT family protein [Gemmatimonadota bacterium]
MKSAATRIGTMAGSTGSALASAAASICCIGPLGIALLGVNGAILAAGIKPYRFHLLAISALFLALGFWGAFRRPRESEGQVCPVRAGRLTRVVLWAAATIWIGAAIIQFVVYPYWLEGGFS